MKRILLAPLCVSVLLVAFECCPTSKITKFGGDESGINKRSVEKEEELKSTKSLDKNEEETLDAEDIPGNIVS